MKTRVHTWDIGDNKALCSQRLLHGHTARAWRERNGPLQENEERCEQCHTIAESSAAVRAAKLGISPPTYVDFSHLQLENIVIALTERATRLHDELKPPPGDEAKASLVMFLDAMANQIKLLEKSTPIASGFRLEVRK